MILPLLANAHAAPPIPRLMKTVLIFSWSLSRGPEVVHVKNTHTPLRPSNVLKLVMFSFSSLSSRNSFFLVGAGGFPEQTVFYWHRKVFKVFWKLLDLLPDDLIFS